MKHAKIILYCLWAAVCIIGCRSGEKNAESPRPAVIAYVGGYRGLVDVEAISSEKITHINYAFVNLVDGRATLSNEATDTVNLRALHRLKNDNPQLKILISIGGWTWSGTFSDAVLTPQGRDLLASSAARIVEDYDLDGVDIDWEYPGFGGLEGNVVRAEDKQNYTRMFAALRARLDSLSQLTGKEYLLTTAVGGFKKFLDYTEMDKAQRYLDFVNLMTYDYYPDTLAVHHTNLYASDLYPEANSGDIAFRAFRQAGVPAEKLVMGISFSSRAFRLKEGSKTGPGDTVVAQTRGGGGFTRIKDSLENRPGYLKGWDQAARAPYLFHPEELLFLTYDDERSVGEKCRYVLENGMGGGMFWEYFSDPKEYLLDAIVAAFDPADSTAVSKSLR